MTPTNCLMKCQLHGRERDKRMKKRFSTNPYEADISQGGQVTNPWNFSFSATLHEMDHVPATQFPGGSGVPEGMAFVHPMPQPAVGSGAETPLNCNMNDTLEVDEIQDSASRRGGRTKKRLARRGKSFNKEEDRMICSAFLNVSKDPVIGTNQSGGGYYQRMHEYFHANLAAPSPRSIIAIQHRWMNIQKAVNKFCGFYSIIERRNESGKTEQDRIDDAMKMYEATEPWQFMHCWLMLRDEPKWTEKMVDINTPGKSTRVNQRPAGEAEASGPDSPMQGDNGEQARPAGRDTSKKRRSRMGREASSSSTAVDMLQRMHERASLKDEKEDTQMAQILQRKDAKISLQQTMLELQRQEMQLRWESEKERREIENKKLELKTQEVQVRKDQTIVEMMKAEAHFMGQDLDKLSPHLREYYMRMQREIMQRHGIPPP